MRRFALALAVSLAACRDEPSPFPEVVVVVDTDLTVPDLASHLRVDVYDERGAWRSSRDFALRSASDYPASFSVFASDDGLSRRTTVRLRLRPDGAERDYRGERFRPVPDDTTAPTAVVPVPEGDGQPRLVEDGVDRTPTSEPLPELTVDRLVEVTLAPGARTRVRVTMRAECMGRMASVAEGATCIDAARAFVAAGGADLDDGAPSLVGTFGSKGAAPPPREGAVALTGGPFVLGADDLPLGLLTDAAAPSAPPRLAIVRPFAIDRDEVSVARMRVAIAKGFVPPLDVTETPGALATSSANSRASCTYRATPDPADPERDELPVNCVPFDTARAFCKREGGDLPTEAQWEYAATFGGRAKKTRFAWGEAAPACDGVIFGRFDVRSQGDTECHDKGFAFGLRGAGKASLDVTPSGVRALAGGVYEWVRGAPLPYDSACFWRAGLVDPLCDADVPARTIRGGDWAAPASSLVATLRGKVPKSGSTPLGGFRCVYGP